MLAKFHQAQKRKFHQCAQTRELCAPVKTARCPDDDVADYVYVGGGGGGEGSGGGRTAQLFAERSRPWAVSEKGEVTLLCLSSGCTAQFFAKRSRPCAISESKIGL